MAVELDIQVDTADVSKLLAQADRNRAVLGKSCRESLQWGGILLCQSLAARTIVSEKKHIVVETPRMRITKDGLVDARYAKYAAIKWRKGSQYLRPIAGYGKGGYTRYKSKSEAAKDKKVIIGRRGLAKKSWGWAAHNMITGGSGKVMGVPDVAVIRWEGGYIDPSVRITNRLRYMEKALEGGYSAVQSALDAAANKMEHEIGRKAAEAYGAT